MKTAKLIFHAIIILLAAIGAFFLFGIFTALIQYLFFIGVLLIAGFIAVKLLGGKSDEPQLDAKRTDKKLKEALRQLEELKRKQFSKR
jgi:hypothetical protein